MQIPSTHFLGDRFIFFLPDSPGWASEAAEVGWDQHKKQQDNKISEDLI